MTRDEMIQAVERKRMIEEVKRKRAEAELGIDSQANFSNNRQEPSSEIAAPEPKKETWRDYLPVDPVLGEAPIIGPLGTMLGEGFRAGIEGTFGDESYGQAYDRIHAENAARTADYEKRHPVLEGVRKIGGGVAGGLAFGPGGSSALTRIGTTTGINAADEYLRSGKAEDAYNAGKLGAGIQTGVEMVPYVGRVAAPVLRPVARGLETVAAGRALKHMLGNYKRAWDTIPENQRRDMGLMALKEGIVRAGRSVGNAASRARDVARNAWSGVEDVWGRMAAEDAGLIPGSAVADKLDQKASEFLDLAGYDPVRKRMAKEASRLRPEPLPEGEIGPAQERMFTPQELQARKNKFQYKEDRPMTVKLGQEGTNATNQAFGEAIKDAVAKSGVPGSENFEQLYQLSGKAGHLADWGAEQATHLKKNRFISPSDLFSGGMGAAVGASITGDPRDATASAILLGVANRLLRTRGNSTFASGLYQASKAIGSSPGQTIGILRGLETGVIGGPAGREAAAQIRRLYDEP